MVVGATTIVVNILRSIEIDGIQSIRSHPTWLSKLQASKAFVCICSIYIVH